jgi:hypothetical protein
MRLNGTIEALAVMIALPVMIVACSSPTSREARQWQPAAITDYKDVAGTWEGLLVRNPRTPKDDWLTLTIREGGAYEFASPRTIGVFGGRDNCLWLTVNSTPCPKKVANLRCNFFGISVVINACSKPMEETAAASPTRPS